LLILIGTYGRKRENKNQLRKEKSEMEYFIKWILTCSAWIVFTFSVIIFILWLIDKLSGKDPMGGYYGRKR